MKPRKVAKALFCLVFTASGEPARQLTLTTHSGWSHQPPKARVWRGTWQQALDKVRECRFSARVTVEPFEDETLNDIFNGIRSRGGR